MTQELTKVNKKATDFEGQVPDYECKLEYYDPSNNNNKYWHIAVYDAYVVRKWGRHGSKGQSSVHQAWGTWAAKLGATQLADQKRSKGYVADTTTALDHMVRKLG
ncbi:MAG: WGR domain-containing protein [Nitrospira sp.]